jgi:hypothetical protein
MEEDMETPRKSLRVKFDRTFTIRHPNLTLSKNIEYLDADKLSKGAHTIEIGRFDGCGCDCVVTADVKDGLIKGFNYPRCEQATKISSALSKKIQAAGAKLAKSNKKWEDIPVRELTRSSAARARIVVVVTTSGDCYEVCIDPGTGLQTCWICCPGWCIGPSDPHVAMM